MTIISNIYYLYLQIIIKYNVSNTNSVIVVNNHDQLNDRCPKYVEVMLLIG